MRSPTPGRSYEIREVAELTGLAAARLRVWERRYEVVRPTRLANRYRVYTSEQVALLRALARLVADGARIGDLIRQPRDQVLARAEGRATDGSSLSRLLDAVKRLDREALATLLAQERARMDAGAFGRQVILPLGEVIGDLWALGRLGVAAEHLASEVVVPELKRALDRLQGAGPGSPVLLGACVPGEHHEWGFLVTLLDLAAVGWRVEYLGPDLPLNDFVQAAWTRVPAVVALSSADPANTRRLVPGLRRLPRLLPPGVAVVLGGQGAEASAARLRRSGLRVGIAMMPSPRPEGSAPRALGRPT
jgi:MerR family transcriptional regulator, light-induced transcriptional regulator